MPDSVRKQILDRVLALMATITTTNGYNTTVKKVSETSMALTEIPNKWIPYVQPMDLDEERETIANPNGSSNSQQGIIDLRISCLVYDKENTTRTKRLNLMQDVEKAMLTDSALDALCLDIEPTRVVTDDGNFRLYSFWDQHFDITYVYDRDNGG